ncbi:MAG: GNAT family N-acetyltransferase [Defluviitaleaceae bacterium]|nr:GNAT family N-acetyltransferase [Defluviitaleaceae bacterium]
MQINLAGFEAVPITRQNYADVWGVYESNPKYFIEHKGRAALHTDILETFERLVEGYNPEKQYFVGMWQEGRCAAVLELLPDFPKQGELWLSELIVHGELHSQGTGSKIVQAVISAAKSLGFNRIALGTDEHLIPFWISHGFSQIPDGGNFIGFELIIDN